MAGDGPTVCKLRGITSNYKTSKLVNFEEIRDMKLTGTWDEPTVVNYTPRRRLNVRGRGGTVSIVTYSEEKLYRISFS